MAFAISYGAFPASIASTAALTAGTLVATASQLRGEAQPFDTETLSLHLETQTLTAAATYGVTDRLDISAAVPIVTVKLRGERVDTYRGQAFPQASAQASASGVGDVLLTVNTISCGAAQRCATVPTRPPTGDE